MTTGQIIIYMLIAFVLFSFIRRYLMFRKISHTDVTEANRQMKNKEIVLLDVRTDAERGSDFIKGSVHIPLNQLKNRVGELQKYKDKKIVCYCRSGNRSIYAALLLQNQGFNVANLKGGLNAWRNS
jgi:rhodanese-related sulfurtransferase